MNHTSEKLYDIVSEFMTAGIIGEITPTGSGHINDSYSVATRSAAVPAYLLQRINHGIFRDVPQLMENILNVSRHVAHKLTEKGSAYPGYQALQPIAAKSGKFFFRDKEGNYWRLYHFISGGRSFDVVGDAKLAREGGRAFAIFQYLTSDLDLSQLKETLPDFHNIETRLRTFRDTVHRDPAGRAKEVTAEIGFVESRAAEMHTIINLGRSGAIPLRVTHNDTKFNNVLFDDHNRAICVVDLDTVMPGYVLYDFGDAIRTGANTGAEDEADLGKVGINLELYKAYAEGYLTISGSFLNSAEIAHLAFSAKFMTFIIGLRFLTDHIDGDRYYRIHHPGHNLQRAKAQFRLLENMEKHYDEMTLIVTKICEAVN